MQLHSELPEFSRADMALALLPGRNSISGRSIQDQNCFPKAWLRDRNRPSFPVAVLVGQEAI